MKTRGFGLLGLLIALAILALLTVTGFSIFSQSGQGIASEDVRVNALNNAQEIHQQAEQRAEELNKILEN